MYSICDCDKAKKHGDKIKCRGGYRYIVDHVEDRCVYCGHFVYFQIPNAKKKHIRDSKRSFTSPTLGGLYEPKQPSFKDYHGGTGKQWNSESFSLFYDKK